MEKAPPNLLFSTALFTLGSIAVLSYCNTRKKPAVPKPPEAEKVKNKVLTIQFNFIIAGKIYLLILLD